MHDFLLKELVTDNIEQELKNIGFDKTYTHFAKKKFFGVNGKDLQKEFLFTSQFGKLCYICRQRNHFFEKNV